MNYNYSKLVKGKNILFIPVYSSHYASSDVYNLATDGNVSRILMKIKNNNAKSITVLYPKKNENFIFIENFIKSNKIKNCNFIPFNYPGNAHLIRNEIRIFADFLINNKNKFDYFILEPEKLVEWCIDKNILEQNKIIYWTNIWTPSGQRWDKDKNNIAEYLATKVKTMCLLKLQVQKYKHYAFYDNYKYESKCFDKQVIFFPFRLSDSEYDLKELKSIVNKLLKEKIKNFIVLYTDTNGSKLLDNEDRQFYQKVSSDKNVYIAILKGRPIIPYFSDLDKNNHSNIFDFIFYKCKIIAYKNKNFKIKNQCKTKDDFYIKIKRILEKNKNEKLF